MILKSFEINNKIKTLDNIFLRCLMFLLQLQQEIVVLFYKPVKAFHNSNTNIHVSSFNNKKTH